MHNKILTPLFIVSLIFGITAVSFAAEKGAPMKKPHPYFKLYSKKCKSCHGKDGKGRATMAKPLKIDIEKLDLTGSAGKSDKALVAITAKGEGKMPAYRKKLKEKEIDGLIDYVRTLIPKKKDKKTEGKKMEDRKEEK